MGIPPIISSQCVPARRADAFLHHFFSPKTIRTLLKAIEQYIRTVAEDLHDMHKQGKLHYKDLKNELQGIRFNDEEVKRTKMKADLLSWVSQVNYSSNYDAAHLRTYDNDRSGDWFLEGRIFSDWWKSDSRSGLLLTGFCEFPTCGHIISGLQGL